MLKKEKMKNFCGLLIFFGCLILVIYSVLLSEQYNFYSAAKRMEKKNELLKAVDNYVMVVYMHVPLSNLEGKSIKALLKISDFFESRDEFRKELYTLERLRSSIYGTRWFFTPHYNVLNSIEPKIALLRVKLLQKRVNIKSPKKTRKEVLKVMRTDLSPNPFLALLGIVSFIFFVVLVVASIFSMVENNEIDGKNFFKYMPFILVFWTVWLVMMYLA